MNDGNRNSAILLASLLCAVALASENPDDSTEADELGRQLSFQCLSQDNQLDCLKHKGFKCDALAGGSRDCYSCYLSIENGCYRTRFQLISDGWKARDAWKPGECKSTPMLDQSADPQVRRQFDNCNAPDPVLFRLFVKGLFSDSLEVANYRMGWRYIQPGATPDTNYELVASYFISKYLEIEKEIHETKTKMMCQNGTPRYSDSTLFSVFDAFDDLNDGIYAKHLALAKIDFADDDTFDLEAALQGYPGSFSVTVVATSGAIDQVYAAAQRFCTEPFKRTFRSTREFD